MNNNSGGFMFFPQSYYNVVLSIQLNTLNRLDCWTNLATVLHSTRANGSCVLNKCVTNIIRLIFSEFTLPGACLLLSHSLTLCL